MPANPTANDPLKPAPPPNNAQQGCQATPLLGTSDSRQPANLTQTDHATPPANSQSLVSSL
ncbi:hypothetical protein BU26DRAFT_520990 [Trematosphaeria pertusa]|uniref:Uncharacterized protein n=1 Tax=Trematosphaeria pertusa TaxID=390896 RepID=A0A6A6I9C0_9PLEO|nr:uncharacterized protein BU26DRAFT_520990 [Trematosphaeria pertusa]KAF2246532.1 hypothetical protein BU26DRAFT_520990 [Trematosphaeria pertusa]